MKSIILIILTALFTILIWEFILQASAAPGGNITFSAGDARGIQSKVTALEQKFSLLSEGQESLYKLERLKKVCRIIKINNYPIGRMVYVYDETGSDGDRQDTKDDYLLAANQDLIEIENHIAVLQSQ